jgi:dihydrofolate reductase
MKISIIAAVAKNNVIGGKGRLLWHIEGDLPRFKQITMGHHILMGQKTYESIGRILPGRTSLILSFNKKYKIPGAFVFGSPGEAVKFAQDRGEKELMIIGGGMIYKYFVTIADKVYLTQVLKAYDGDVTFPKINKKEWKEKVMETHPETDPPYNLVLLERK